MNELVKAQLEAVGFKVKLEVMDWNALLDVAIKGREKYRNTTPSTSAAPRRTR
jgi:peptide/nickel transport system substrate-binding protein